VSVPVFKTNVLEAIKAGLNEGFCMPNHLLQLCGILKWRQLVCFEIWRLIGRLCVLNSSLGNVIRGRCSYRNDGPNQGNGRLYPQRKKT